MLKIKDFYIDGAKTGDSVRSLFCAGKKPFFGWSVLSAKNGNRQKSYRITVTFMDEVLWDSGEVETSEQSAVYDGDDLPAGREVELSLDVTDIYGNRSGVYITSFMNAEIDWDAEWIAPDEDRKRAVIYFRKNINIDKELSSAYIFMCGLGYHDLSVNGISASPAMLDPAHSDYSKTCYYSAESLTDSLESGENCIGIKVADGWRRNDAKIFEQIYPHRSIPFFGRPQLSAIIELNYADGTTERIKTDTSWQYTYGAITSSNIFDGETYDAGLEISDWDCADSRYDGFRSPVTVSAPGGKMLPMVLTPIYPIQQYEARTVTNTAEGRIVIDFGQNISGFVVITPPAGMKCGETITLKHMEFLDEDGNLYLPNLREAKATDTYIASGNEDGLSVWHPLFTYHGFRYAQIEGLGNYIEKDKIWAMSIYTSIDNDSFFECGDPLVNKIHQNIVFTERDNMHSILTDCPQRDERMGWMNDATVRFEETPYNFDIGHMFPKIIRDILDTQDKDGAITCCAPYIFGMRPADPVCSSFLVAGLQALMFTGNKRIIAEAYDGFAAWEANLGSHSEDYIVNYSYYGDWASPAYVCPPNDGAHSLVTPGIFMSTGYYYYNAILLAKFAEVLGKYEDEKKYRLLAENIRSAMLARWFDPETGRMATGSQAAQAFSLWLGIIPEDKCALAAQVMRYDLVFNDYKITTGNLCSRYLLDMLCKYGYVDDAWKIMTRKEYPSFGYMIQNEATTIWERFELKKNPGMNSHNHPMYGAAGYWLYAYIGGITPLSPAFDRIKIQPYIPSALLSCTVSVDTLKGDIVVRWVKRYGKTYLYVTVPFGASAQIHFDDKIYEVESGFHMFNKE